MCAYRSQPPAGLHLLRLATAAPPPGHRDCLLRQLLHPPVYCLQFDESIRAGHSGKPACSDMMGGLSYWDWIGLPENKWRCAAVDELVVLCPLLSACWEAPTRMLLLLWCPPAALIAAVVLRSCITSSQPAALFMRRQERFDAAMGVVQKLSAPAILQASVSSIGRSQLSALQPRGVGSSI